MKGVFDIDADGSVCRVSSRDAQMSNNLNPSRSDGLCCSWLLVRAQPFEMV
jgi:hypothetical protein